MKKIEIVAFDNGEVVKTFGPTSDFSAEKIELGLNINLNHDKYYTRQVDVEEGD